MFSVVIPASGIGKRMQSSTPKQYLPLLGKTVLEYTINCFLDLPEVDQIIVVIAPHDRVFNTLPIASHPKIHTVIGGKERANSVLNGVKYLHEKNSQWVMVHDAARPCLEQQDIVNLASQCIINDYAGILATQVRDTMKRSIVGSNFISRTEDRNNLWHALTPQCCNVSQLYQAFIEQISTTGEINPSVTDEASALELAGYDVALIAGSAKNIKITQPEDLELAEYYIKSKKNEF
jgi:2-C-methyl-D-erythritol 4-phosphate cytidylyltransferase